MMMMTSTNQIERVLSRIEPTTSAESMIVERAIVECRARSQSMGSKSTMRTSSTLLLGPLSLLLCLLLVLVGHTLGGYPDVEVAGTGSQGQISNSLGSQTHAGLMQGGYAGRAGIVQGPLTCDYVVDAGRAGPCRPYAPAAAPTLGGAAGRDAGWAPAGVVSTKTMKKKEGHRGSR